MTAESILVGRFSPRDFKAVSRRLEDASVSFEVECDTTAPSINVEGVFSERATVAVVVRSKEAAVAAATIIDAWHLEIGHVDPQTPNQQPEPMRAKGPHGSS